MIKFGYLDVMGGGSDGGVAGGFCTEYDEGEPSWPASGGVCLEVNTLDLSILTEVFFDVLQIKNNFSASSPDTCDD